MANGDSAQIQARGAPCRRQRGQDPADSGRNWLALRDADVQDAVLGKAGAGLWRAGKVSLSDFVGYHEDPRWGRTMYQKSLKELGSSPQEIADARNGKYPPVPMRVLLPGGGSTFITPGDADQYNAGANLDSAQRAEGWGRIDDLLQGLRQ